MRTRFTVALLLAALIVGATAPTASAVPAPASHARGGLTFSGYSWNVHSSGKWSASHTWVQHGILNMKVSGGKGGGVAMRLDRTYGTYKVRFRMDAGAGSKYVILLWPAHCPAGPPTKCRPEIDFGEDDVGDAHRTRINATYHPGPGCSHCTHLRLGGNFTAWHTAGLIWKPGSLSFTMDGRVWAHLNVSVKAKMHLSLQSTQYGHGPPATFQVSSVHVS